ncbi:hypothetical protein Vadar_021505 [Vaccinium darrowii]|uniref:Uncharacterized protein n=1 Tax=Vaccinium darrowii TaxID=229202 RepID=A0ACB7Y8N4_9ERIC|nr:hypothetical protein Vadar_021505 [Vaccinium darrowii]
MRLDHIVGSSLNPNYFTTIVRAIPSSPEESWSDSVKNFFTNYHPASYLSHQMVYRSGRVQKPMNDESKMIKGTSTEQLGTYLSRGLCGGKAHSFKVLSSEPESVGSQDVIANPDLRDKECAAALVFFKTRNEALIASQVLQSATPMSWVTDLAPEPHDVYWKNLCIPFWQLWLRRIAMRVASIVFTILFMQVHDPSDNRVPSQCRTDVVSATFFMTYIMTSGWTSLAFEIMQPCALVCNFFYKYILRKKDEPSNGTLSFPYHTEIPRLLLFGCVGFTYSPTAPLILPFLVVYFYLASVVYRNQILNVYVTKYQSGGQFWPMIHNTTIFSLVVTQVISIGVFGLKRLPVAAGLTTLLIPLTLLFSEYCRQRFHPVFKDNIAAQVLITMDRIDEQCGSMEVIHKQLPSAYFQFASTANELRKSVSLNLCNDGDDVSICVPEDLNPGFVNPTLVKAQYFASKHAT